MLSPKDYCLKALTGETVSDAMTNFFVVGLDLAYVEPLIARVAGARERLPPLKGFADVVGEIALGASGRRARVVTGTMDAWSGLVGAGVARAGQGVYMSGTSEIVAIASRKRIGAPGIVTFPEAAGLIVNAGPTQSGGDALQWWAEASGCDVAGVLALAGEADRDGRPILFLPHLEGERAPLWDAELRGAFVGLDRRAGAPDMALAVLEGVALSGRLLFEACDAAAGGATARLFLAGGGARSDLWAQIRADCLGLPLDRVACLDVGCLGAAMMAAVGVGAYPTLAEAVSRMARVERTFEPDPRRKGRYDALFDAYSAGDRGAEADRPPRGQGINRPCVTFSHERAMLSVTRGLSAREGEGPVSDAARILIADDHPLVLGALRQAVSGAIQGVEIHEAHDFDSLAATLEAHPDMDLVLLDLSMPGVRGFSGLLYLRAERPGVPVIVVSGNEDRAVMRHCLEFGAAAYVPKSLDVETMRSAIRAVLDGGRWTPPDLDAKAPGQQGGDRAGQAPVVADAAAGAGPDDAEPGPAQQADRLRAQRLRGDGQGACLGDPAEARRRKPHPGRHRRGQDRACAGSDAGGVLSLSRGTRTA